MPLWKIFAIFMPMRFSPLQNKAKIMPPQLGGHTGWSTGVIARRTERSPRSTVDYWGVIHGAQENGRCQQGDMMDPRSQWRWLSRSFFSFCFYIAFTWHFCNTNKGFKTLFSLQATTTFWLIFNWYQLELNIVNRYLYQLLYIHMYVDTLTDTPGFY